MLEKLIALDTKLFLFLNGLHSPFWDDIMCFLSGKTEWVPLYIIIIGYIVYKFRWRSLLVFVAVTLVITLADQISVKAFKDVFMRLRPSHSPEIQHLVHIVNDYRGGQYGFVSSHAANTFGLATFLALLIRARFFTVFIFTWASLVSYSRIYLGVHYPGDIICGAILGAGCAITVFILYRWGDRKIYNNEQLKNENLELSS